MVLSNSLVHSVRTAAHAAPGPSDPFSVPSFAFADTGRPERYRATFRQPQRQYGRRHHESSGAPKTAREACKLEHDARNKSAQESSAGVRHVIKAHVESNAVFVGIGEHQIRMDRGVDGENHRKDGQAPHQSNAGIHGSALDQDETHGDQHEQECPRGCG